MLWKNCFKTTYSVQDSFIKSSLRRLTSTFGPGSAEHRAQKRERLDIKYGYAGFKKARCKCLAYDVDKSN